MSRICEAEPPCATCRGEPTFCTDCVQGTYLLGNECVTCNHPCVGCLNAYSCFKCDDGYYLVTGTVDECLPCLYPCLTCYQPSFCTSCGWEPEKRNDDRYCRCKPGFFQLGQTCTECTPPCIKCSDLENCFNCDNENTGLFLNMGKCVPCVYPCMTCLSINFCLRCGYDVEKRVPDATCRCNDGWWDDGQECRACVPPCNKCTSDTFCTYCTNEMTGLFANDEGLCEKCWYPCVTCTSEVDCLTCGWEPELRNPDWNCKCKVGFYECGTKCKPCIAPCRQCTSETNCIDCNNADSGTFYFVDYCRPCEYPCATCSSITSCLTCGFGPERRVESTTCPCKVGFFEQGYQCAECVNPCKNCDSPTICHDCDDLNSGFYKNIENRCVRCVYPCETCKSADFCYTCLSFLNNRIQDDPTCPCEPGWFENDRECLTCRPPCRQCNGLSVECLTCIEGSYLDGTYCKWCVYPCVTCSSETECITCGWGMQFRKQPQITGETEYMGETRYTYDDQSCPCKDGYYASGKYCLPCVLPCTTCTDQTTCTTLDCENAVSRTYLEGGICKPCQYPCENCKDSPNQSECLSCGYGADRRDLDLYNCGCADGYYEVLSEKICVPCVKPCIKCSAADVCTEFDCQKSTSGMYYDSGSGRCVDCVYPCKLCESATICIECGWDVEFRNNKPDCGCKFGYYEDGQECFKCVPPCTSCTSQTACLTIHCHNHESPATGELLLTSRINMGNTTCSDCNYPCLTCAEGAPSACRSCGYGAALRVAPYHYCYRGCGWSGCSYRWEQSCGCKAGYYHRVETQECLPCEYPCTQCVSQTQCHDRSYCRGYTYYHNSCQDSTTGLYMPGLRTDSASNPGVCVACTYPCITCWDTGRYCYTCGWGPEKRHTYYRRYGVRYGNCNCLDGFYEEDQECKPCKLPCVNCSSAKVCLSIYDCDKAFSGLYPDNSNLECKKCPYPCKFCDSPTQCTVCGYGPDNRYDPPGCGCKSGYYEKDNLCLKCILPCLTCSDETTCETIYDCDYMTSGYYPDNLTCKKCEYPCVTCSTQVNCVLCGWDVERRNAPSHHKSCQCRDGYFDRDNECLECRNPCETCTDEVTCVSVYDCDNLTSGSYADPYTATCKDCPYPCLTCSSATHCHTCDGNLDNRKAAPYCTCEDGFYNRVDECVRCPLPCAKCSSEFTCTEYYNCDNSVSRQFTDGLNCNDCEYPCVFCTARNVCTICDTELDRRNDNSSCRCKEGYYDSGNSCKLCKLPCLACTGPLLADCTAYYTCQPGYTRNTSTKKCVRCNYPCKTCADGRAWECTTCGWGPSLRDVYRHDRWYEGGGYQYKYCQCKQGYYHVADNKECYRCNYPCSMCWSGTDCRNEWRNSQVDTYCDYSNTRLYYRADSGKEFCWHCYYPCHTCLGGATNCYSCGYGPENRKPISSWWDPHARVTRWDRSCACKDGFYEDGQECKPCVKPCKDCDSATNCISYECDNDLSGQYFNALTDRCEDCEFPCKSCYGTKNSCTQCASDAENRKEPSQGCGCKDGFFKQGNICIECKLPCRTCTGEKQCIDYDCQNASSGMFLYIPPNDGEWNDPNCELMNEEDQAYNGCIFFKPSCKRCEYPCETCTSSTDCLDCGFTPENRKANTCSCKAGTFLFNTIECIQNGCNSPCATCTGASNCDTCIDGYYLLGFSCQPCATDINCKTCIDDMTCSSCGDDYYLDEGACLPCEYPCIKCKSATFCLECGYDKEYRLDVPSCRCLSDFYDSGAGCLKCTAPCNTCNSPSQTDCITCNKGYFIMGKSCMFCPEACQACTDPLTCQECTDGYYLQGTDCLPCQYPCETCMDEVFCYTCKFESIRVTRPPECACDNGNDYWENGMQECSKCDDPCRACDEETGVCISCVLDHYYVEDGSTKQRFVQAADGEVTRTVVVMGVPTEVTGNMVDYTHYGDCHQCMEGCKKCDVADICIQCHDGYYKQGNICVVCKTPCATCLSDTKCITCGYGPELRYNAPGCKCFERRSNPNLRISDHGDKCDVCQSPCLDCNGPTTSDCTSCEEYHYLDGGQCLPCDNSCYRCDGPNADQCNFDEYYQCRDGYYPSSGNECTACVYPCATCASPTYCHTCGYDTERRNNAPDCRCEDQYTDDHDNQQCNQCTTPCRTCNSDFPNDCRSCVYGYFLDTDGVTCTQCDSQCTRCTIRGDNCQTCADQYYLDGESCVPCVYPCVTCFSAVGCYSCGFAPEKRYSPPACGCQEAYSEIGQNCVSCLSPCKKCDTSDMSCTACVHKYYLTGNTCTQCPTICAQCTSDSECQKCEDGYYLDGNSCLPCQAPCENCTGPTFCLTCGYEPAKRVVPPSCACQYEYIELGNVCTICTHPCKTCDGTAQTDCLSCEIKYYLEGRECKLCVDPCKTCENAEDQCLTCIDGYYMDSDTGLCTLCEFPCINCYSKVDCLTCGYTPARRIDPPSCDCKSEYTAVGQACEFCVDPCVTCTEPQADKCLSCKITDYLDGTECKPCNPGCVSCESQPDNCSKCEPGYFQDGRDCVQCTFPCVECYGPGLCITCGGIASERIGPPLCECLVDTWSDDRSLGTCVTCPHPCRWCDSDSTSDCTRCVNEFYLVDKECIPCQTGCRFCDGQPENCSECIDGYYLEGTVCKQCKSPCSKCTSDIFCLECGFGPALRITPPTCKCKDTVDSNGKLLGDQGDMCVVCVDPCRHCNGTGPNNCLSCIDGFVHDGEDNSCQACQPGCIGCTFFERDTCTSCFDGYFLRGTECLPCAYPCTTCLETDYCFTCGHDPDSRRNIPPSCQCDYQYHDNGVKCLLCQPPCKTCQNEVNTDCYSCIDKFYLDGDEGTMQQCLPCGTGCATCKNLPDECYSCLDEYYLDGEQCKECVYPCETCLNETFCFTCGFDVANKNPAPSCSCKHGMSDSYDGEIGCITCNSPCYTCSSTANDDCLSCIEDHYLDNKQCLPCYEGCNRCTQQTVCQECNDGWFLDGETCVPCSIPCQYCLDSTRCITCVDNVNRYIEPSCQCQDGYYESSDGEGCIQCQVPGHVCTTVDSFRTCADGYYWKSDGEYHDDGEEVTWHHYSLQGTCLPCVSPCQTCLNDTFCYQCTSASHRGDAPDCICENGYFNDADSGQCLICPPPILECENATFATKCHPGHFIKDNECLQCQYPCVTCLVLTTCESCHDNINRRDVPECTCMPGYYDQKEDGEELKECIECPSPSTVCINDVKFLACEDTFYWKDDTLTCESCVYPCLHCVSPVFCTACGYEPLKRAPPQTCFCLYGEYYQADPAHDYCTACTAPCKRCLNATHCLSCQDGFTLDGEDCIPCLETVGSACAKCVGSICLSCGLDIEGPNTPSCDCLQETGDSGTYQECYDADRELCPLLPCQPPCENCYSATNCKTCIDNDFRYAPEDGENSCKCLPGFEPNWLNKCNKVCGSGKFGVGDQCYDCVDPCSECDGEAHLCTDCVYGYKYYGNFQCLVQCLFPCATCNGPTECITCAALYRDDGENCACQAGYFEVNYPDQEFPLCQECVHPCKTCDDAVTCNLCVDGEFRQGPEGNCQCEAGFSEFEGACIKECEPGTYVNYDQCVDCHPQCKTCKGAGSHCIVCNKGYYRNGLTCDRCPNNCLDCNGDGECTECDMTQHGRQDILPTCACMPGTFERGTTDCGVCTVPCVTCNTTRIHCEICVEGGVNRKAAPDCTCDDGYYDTEGTCKDCGYKCDTCEFEDDYCVVCKPGGIGRDLTAPECACSPGYFEVGVLHCSECQYPCATCEDNPTNCLTCVFETEQRHDPNDCNCLDSYYRDGGDHCQPCLWKCLTCRDQDDKCLVCDGENRSLPTCDCKTGYFGLDPNLECFKCDDKCKKCSGTSDNCDVCRPGPNRKLKPDCTCEDGYYNNEVNICVPCRHPCSTCDDADTCKVCVMDMDPNRHDIMQNCQCHYGYYSNGVTCAKCHDACLSCEGNELNCVDPNPAYVSGGCAPQCQICSGGKDNCIKCNSGAYRIDDAVKGCPCKDGYYGLEDTADCLPCKPVCAKCFNGEQCSVCKNPKLQPPFCKNEIGKVAEVTTSDGDVGFESCGLQCDTCSKKPDNCLTCGNGQFRYGNPPTCDCIQGYHDEGRTQKDCIPCPKICDTCSSSKTCLSCKQGLNRELDPYTNECKCKFGYKAMEDNDLECSKCYDYMGDCYLICPGQTLQNEQLMICEEKNYQFQDNVYLIVLAGAMISLIAITLFLGTCDTLKRKYKMGSANPYEQIRQQSKKKKVVYDTDN